MGLWGGRWEGAAGMPSFCKRSEENTVDGIYLSEYWLTVLDVDV